MIKRLVLLLFALIVIIMSVWFVNYIKPFKKLHLDEAENILAICNKIEKYQEKCEALILQNVSKCIIEKKFCYEFAISLRNYSYCFFDEKCIKDVAEITGNPKICNRILMPRLKNECLAFATNDSSFCQDDSCFFYLATKTENHLLCDKAGELEFTCYRYIAQKTGNSNICIGITDIIKRNLCLALADRNVDLCNQTGTFQDICYINIASIMKNEHLCEKTNEEWEDVCYVHVAKSSSNEQICNKIQSNFHKASCYLSLAQIKGKTELCDLANKFTSIDVEMCYFDVALKLAKIKIYP